jgi:hypothetical protein
MSGNGNSQERFLQTLHTIDSIKSKFPTAEIWILEGSHQRLGSYFDISMYKYLDCDKIFDFSNSERLNEIREFSKQFNPPVAEKVKDQYINGYIKNLSELHMLNSVFSNIDFSRYDHISKISGRYSLSRFFDESRVFHKNKMTITSMQEHKVVNMIGEYATQCIYWNFCTSIGEEIKGAFLHIEQHVISRTQLHQLADIEHAICLFIPKLIIHEIPFFGITGRLNNEKFIQH